MPLVYWLLGELVFYFILLIFLPVFVLCIRRSCVAVEFCWLAVKVACCSAECADVSSILQNGPVTTFGYGCSYPL